MSLRTAPRDPETETPPRRPGSVRRTSQIVMSFEDPGLVLDGSARDLLTRGEPRDAEVVGSAAVRAEMGGHGRKLVRLKVMPDRPGLPAALLGSRVGSGFRAQVRALAPAEEGGALGLLLDDLPGAALISGYVHMRGDVHAGQPAGASAPKEALGRMSDLCSGWRAGGDAMASVARGEGIPVQDCPPAPDLDSGIDPLAWQPMAPLVVGTMRRRRRIDVAPRGGAAAYGLGGDVEVDAMFRDTYGEPDGTEVVLHEYSLNAVFRGRELEIGSIEARPHVLPFWECPLAAPYVTDLIGTPAGELRRLVPQTLNATRSCTHLNDLLRVLADVPALAGFLG